MTARIMKFLQKVSPNGHQSMLISNGHLEAPPTYASRVTIAVS